MGVSVIPHLCLCPKHTVRSTMGGRRWRLGEGAALTGKVLGQNTKVELVASAFLFPPSPQGWELLTNVDFSCGISSIFFML